ncbi:MAG: cytidine deaminase [Ginsengibacter sp.]
MKTIQHVIDVTEYESSEELSKEDAALLQQARVVTEQAYAPYSNFKVGAVALLANGSIVSGTNQENASYPVGICAERVLLSVAASQFPGVAIHTIAVSHKSSAIENYIPASPCGMCRQALAEQQERFNKSIRLILSGQNGRVHVIENAGDLLPFAFESSNLNS